MASTSLLFVEHPLFKYFTLEFFEPIHPGHIPLDKSLIESFAVKFLNRFYSDVQSLLTNSPGVKIVSVHPSFYKDLLSSEWTIKIHVFFTNLQTKSYRYTLVKRRTVQSVTMPDGEVRRMILNAFYISHSTLNHPAKFGSLPNQRRVQ